MVALVLAVTVLFGMTGDFTDEIAAYGTDINGADGVVNTYVAMASPMGLEYDSVNGWLWQASEDAGNVYTVDPSDGTYTQRFNISTIFYGADLNSNGIYLDEGENVLYLADYNGDTGVTFNDVVYAFDVDDPDSPILIDTWNFGANDGILGIAYKNPYFYCTFYGAGEIRAYTLTAGGAFTQENMWSGSYGGIWYHETWNVFYTHDALGATVRILDGDDLGIVIDSFSPGCTLTDGMTNDPDPSYLWTSDFNGPSNIQFDNEYTPSALEQSTWGSIKTTF